MHEYHFQNQKVYSTGSIRQPFTFSHSTIMFLYRPIHSLFSSQYWVFANTFLFFLCFLPGNMLESFL